jgi:hypothetical protein
MEEKIKDCILKLNGKYPQKSICIGVNFWHFNHDNHDETKFSLYMETGENMEMNTIDQLIKMVDFILSLPTTTDNTNA